MKPLLIDNPLATATYQDISHEVFSNGSVELSKKAIKIIFLTSAGFELFIREQDFIAIDDIKTERTLLLDKKVWRFHNVR